jgi:hypothetical protein
MANSKEYKLVINELGKQHEYSCTVIYCDNISWFFVAHIETIIQCSLQIESTLIQLEELKFVLKNKSSEKIHAHRVEFLLRWLKQFDNGVAQRRTKQICCPICTKVIKDQVYTCVNNHKLCIKCRCNVQVCPFCRLDLNTCSVRAKVANVTGEKVKLVLANVANILFM